MAEARAHNFTEARRLFIRALALNPRHIPAIGGLAHAEALAGNLHSARNLYARALQVRARLQFGIVPMPTAVCGLGSRRRDGLVWSFAT